MPSSAFFSISGNPHAKLGEYIQAFKVAEFVLSLFVVGVLIDICRRKVSRRPLECVGCSVAASRPGHHLLLFLHCKKEPFYHVFPLIKRFEEGITTILQGDGLPHSSSRISLSQQSPYNLKQVSFSTSKYPFLDLSPIFKTVFLSD